MRKKTLIWVLLNLGVVVFVIMSIIIYYLVPAATSGAEWFRNIVEQLINIFR